MGECEQRSKRELSRRISLAAVELNRLLRDAHDKGHIPNIEMYEVRGYTLVDASLYARGSASNASCK